MDRDYIKYIFIGIIIIFILVAGIIFLTNSKEDNKIVDQTSTNTNIKKNLRLAIANFDTINPILSNNKNVQEFSKFMFNSLITLDGEMKMEYALATEIGKTDNKEYILKLRDNVYWSNGQKFNADDVKFTVDTIKSGIQSIYSENLKDVSSLEIIDDYTIKIILDREIPFFEYNLTFPILSSLYYAGEDFTTTQKNLTPVTTGMYKIDNVEEGKISLVKNQNYWNKEKDPTIEQIEIKLYNSAGEVYNAFKTGDIDIININITNVEKYVGSIGYNKAEYKGRDYDFLSFNSNSQLFSNVAVKKAINFAIDKNVLIGTSLGNGFKPSNFFFDFESWLYDSKMDLQSNPDMAKRILEEDGWDYKNNRWSKTIDGRYVAIRFDIIVNASDEIKVAAAENIQSQLSNIGMEVNVRKVSQESYLNYLQNKNYDCILTGVRSGFSPSLETFFGENNIANYNNDEVKNILNEAKNVGEQEKIKQIYSRLYDIYMDEVPYIGLYRKSEYVILNQGLICNLNPNSFSIFSNIEKWYRQ